MSRSTMLELNSGCAKVELVFGSRIVAVSLGAPDAGDSITFKNFAALHALETVNTMLPSGFYKPLIEGAINLSWQQRVLMLDSACPEDECVPFCTLVVRHLD